MVTAEVTETNIRQNPPDRGNAFVAHDARDRLVKNGYPQASAGCSCLSHLSHAFDAASSSVSSLRSHVGHIQTDVATFRQDVSVLIEGWKYMPDPQRLVALDLDLMREALEGSISEFLEVCNVGDQHYTAAERHLRAAENHLIAA